MKKTLLAVTILLGLANYSNAQPGKSQMLTEWSSKVDKKKPLNDYPRPNMVRADWKNLNGQWDYAIVPKSDKPGKWEGKILVPFPVESYLSGVQRTVGKDSSLWYKHGFSLGKIKSGEKVLLHFGAVDWQTDIYLNDKKVGSHEGGYTSFSFDVTSFLNGKQEELKARVYDPTDDGLQARGKQVKHPKGIYYTPVTGIWQTIWLEVVPETHVASYRVVTDIDKGTVTVKPEITALQDGDKVSVTVFDGNKQVATKELGGSNEAEIKLSDAKLWSPEHPHLYTFRLNVTRNTKTIDKIEGYFGMRKIAVAKDKNGTDRLFLNNQPLFQYGPLDQGYWPDGIYTAPTDEALVSDIELMKNAGFNMVRKHVKVEPARWYYNCDKMGLIVWQDMPSGFGEIVPVKDHEHSIENDWLANHYKDVDRDEKAEADYRNEWKAIINQLYNYPSICLWVPFNESWGQFKTNEILKWTKELDPTRVVDGPSGWIDRGEGETRDYHLYGDRLKELPVEKNRALVIGEFGGLGYAVADHVMAEKSWSYQGFKNSKDLTEAYGKLIEKVALLKEKGFSAAVYTQLTDVETEINGLVTYDRRVMKVNLNDLKKLSEQLTKEQNAEGK